MANRKGVAAVSKWACSDGTEFTSARDANDHQGALNETEKFFEPFADMLHSKQSEFQKFMTIIIGGGEDENRKILGHLIFEWEKFKNQNAANPALLPEDGMKSTDDQSGEGKPSITMDEKSSDSPAPEKAPAKKK